MELAKCAVVAVFLYFILKLILSQKTKTQNKEREERKPLPVEGAYKKRWLLTYNEKDAYKKLLDAASEVGYTIFFKSAAAGPAGASEWKELQKLFL